MISRFAAEVDQISADYYRDLPVWDDKGNPGLPKLKKKSLTVEVQGVRLTNTFQLARHLNILWHWFGGWITGQGEGERLYDPADAAVKWRELDRDQRLALQVLSPDTVRHRVLVFIETCCRCYEDETLLAILEAAPKKRDKTLAQNRTTRIASMQGLSANGKQFVLVGVPQSDTELLLKVRREKFQAESQGLARGELFWTTDLFLPSGFWDREEIDRLQGGQPWIGESWAGR